MAFVFGLQTHWLINITKIFQLNGLKPKNKGQTNFYECCDLTKKVYLTLVYRKPSSFCILDAIPCPLSLFSILGAPVFVLWGINVDPVWVNALFFCSIRDLICHMSIWHIPKCFCVKMVTHCYTTFLEYMLHEIYFFSSNHNIRKS